MPLKKIVLKPGVNRENTRYTNENGWYECDKIRFRQGTPEKIGGWSRISTNSFLGVARALWNWITNTGVNYLAVGTNLKYYVENGGVYYDITPLRGTATLTNPFTATNGSTTLTVADVAHGALTGDFVTFSGAAGLGGNVTAGVLNAEYQVTVIDDDSYTVTLSVAANATDAAGSPGGGGAVSAAYQLNTGAEFQVPLAGWSGGAWGGGAWGVGDASLVSLLTWSQVNFGEDLVFGPRDGGIYYWDSSVGVATRGVEIGTLGSASDTPVVQKFIFLSDVNRFVFAMGVNDIGSTVLDPMLIRWADQESVVNWSPASTNQAGSLRLSHGSELVLAIQARQEIVVLSDSAVYSLQYLGPPAVWGAQLLGDNISVISANAAAIGTGVVYWMGKDKFYFYDGRVNTLSCDLLRFVFGRMNYDQIQQVCAGTNEGYNEIWWFYPANTSVVNDSYVVYNYLEKVWYYGTIGRTAWLDTPLREYPVAATYSNNIVSHEYGVDNDETGTLTAIEAYAVSAEFDIEDGHNFGFVRRVLPDVTFEGSTADSPSVLMTLTPLKNAGAGYTDPASVGGESEGAVVRSVALPVEEFTGQLFIRVRGRQLVMRIESTAVGVTWQLGAPRIDIRPDGRK